MKTLFLFTILPLLLFAPARAQLSIEWSTSDGGGGISAGGSYSLSGTLAQIDATTPAEGSSFSLTGGYWTFPPDAPALPDMSITLDGGVALLTWDAPGFPVVLEASADLQLWEPVDPQPVGSYYYDTETARRYYRLRPVP